MTAALLGLVGSKAAADAATGFSFLALGSASSAMEACTSGVKMNGGGFLMVESPP